MDGGGILGGAVVICVGVYEGVFLAVLVVVFLLWWLWGWCLCGSGGCIDYVVVTFLFVCGGAVLVCVLVMVVVMSLC